MELNIADKLYITMYEIIVVKLLPTLPTVVSNIKPSLFLVMNLSIALIGLGLIFSKLQMLSAIKLTIATIICSSLLLNPVGTIYLLNFMQQIFIDGPVKMGTVIVNTIGSALNITQQITLEPNPNNSTAFGRLWEITSSLAVAVWDSGGMSDIGAFFLGAALFAIAIALLGGQILILGTSLIIVSTSIFVSPVFIPMVLFKSTRNMFQSWVGFALGGGFGLIILLTLTGIIFGFMAISFNEVFSINIVTDSFDDIEDANDMNKISAVILFMVISIKLLPNVSMWASSLAGASAAGVTDGLTKIGTSAAQQAGLLTKKAAIEAGNQANERIVKPATNQVKRGIGKLSNIARSKFGKNNDSSVDSQKLTQQSKQSALKSDIKDRLKGRSGQRGGKLDQLSAAESRIANFSRQLPSPEKFDANQTKGRLKQSLNKRNNSDYVRPLSNQSKFDHQINTKKGLKQSLADRGNQNERPLSQQVKREGEVNLKNDLKQRLSDRGEQSERPLSQQAKREGEVNLKNDLKQRLSDRDEQSERPLSQQAKREGEVNLKNDLKQRLSDRDEQSERPLSQQGKREGEVNLKNGLKQRLANREEQNLRPISQQARREAEIKLKKGLRQQIGSRENLNERPLSQHARREDQVKLKSDLNQRLANRVNKNERPLSQQSKHNREINLKNDLKHRLSQRGNLKQRPILKQAQKENEVNLKKDLKKKMAKRNNQVGRQRPLVKQSQKEQLQSNKKQKNRKIKNLKKEKNNSAGIKK